jgi:hypothetical protein
MREDEAEVGVHRSDIATADDINRILEESGYDGDSFAPDIISLEWSHLEETE